MSRLSLYPELFCLCIVSGGRSQVRTFFLVPPPFFPPPEGPSFFFVVASWDSRVFPLTCQLGIPFSVFTETEITNFSARTRTHP